ncbi:MAG: hypothetical protein II073_05660, partial [Lachnospiraceae bacterium]|nr:hypothetical protein [Lachnospiraceae bacterium]
MQEKDKKVYMIDSENVGDLWVTHVIQLANAEDEILVFYTQKSPHMGYDTIIKLLDSSNKVQFIKCIEGRNALDFQLVTELGYRIGTQEEEKTYIIVTNDTGFDAVVQYWKMVNVEVRRYSAKYCQNQYNKKLCEDKLHPLVKNETDSNGQENIVQGEKELLLEEQLSLFGNQIGTKESQFGLPAKTETVRTTEIATKVEKPVAVEVPKTEEAPVVEEVSKTEEAPVVEEVSKTEETPVVEEVSKTEEAPVVVEVSKTEKAPVAVEVSKTEKVPVELKTVATAEKGIQVEM